MVNRQGFTVNTEWGVEAKRRVQSNRALAAIFALLPAALSSRVGSQTQRPLAIVVGGVVITLLLTAT